MSRLNQFEMLLAYSENSKGPRTVPCDRCCGMDGVIDTDKMKGTRYGDKIWFIYQIIKPEFVFLECTCPSRSKPEY